MFLNTPALFWTYFIAMSHNIIWNCEFLESNFQKVWQSLVTFLVDAFLNKAILVVLKLTIYSGQKHSDVSSFLICDQVYFCEVPWDLLHYQMICISLLWLIWKKTAYQIEIKICRKKWMYLNNYINICLYGQSFIVPAQYIFCPQ